MYDGDIREVADMARIVLKIRHLNKIVKKREF